MLQSGCSGTVFKSPENLNDFVKIVSIVKVSIQVLSKQLPKLEMQIALCQNATTFAVEWLTFQSTFEHDSYATMCNVTRWE